MEHTCITEAGRASKTQLSIASNDRVDEHRKLTEAIHAGGAKVFLQLNHADAVEIVIEGGCHSYFGSYGMQDGDGTPAIPREAQIARTADAIAQLAASAALETAE